MGRSNLGACANQPDVVVTAACDVWESRRNAVVNQFKDTCKGYAISARCCSSRTSTR